MPKESPPAQSAIVKADLLYRFLAKFIDFLIVGGLSRILSPFGALAGLTYLLISDGFLDGRSLGKKLMDLRVVQRGNFTPCTFRESILRNLPLSIAVIFAMFPYLGLLFFSTGGLLIIAFESYLIVSDEDGSRIGDILADTMVIGAAGGAGPRDGDEDADETGTPRANGRARAQRDRRA